MIGVKDQYEVLFDIGDKKDFLKESDLASFTIIESAGNVLPEWELSFSFKEDELIPYFSEGNVITYIFGRTTNDKTECSLRILKKEIEKAGKQRFDVYLAGVYDAVEYVSNCKIRAFKDKSGIDVWMRTDVPKSFAVLGISTDGKFRARDLVSDVGRDPDWRFTHQKLGRAKEVLVDNNQAIVSNSGFMNHWMSYGRKQSVRTLESAEDNLVEPNMSDLLVTQGGVLDRHAAITDRVAEFGILNDNVHAKYWESYYHNLAALAMFSSAGVSVSYSKVMLQDMRVLDLVSFEDERTSDNQLVANYSGLYFITKLGRTISKRQLVTTVMLSRETLGELTGDLR